MTVTINGTTGISSPGGDTSTSLATTNLSYTGTLTGSAGVINIGFGQVYKDTSGNVGIGIVPATSVKTNSYSANSSPASSGTSQTGALRLTYVNSTALDFGAINASPYGHWIQAVDTTNLANTYPLLLNPNGGNVGIGTSSPTGKLQVKAANPQIFMEDSAAGTNGKFTAIGTSNGTMTFSRYLDNGSLVGQYMTLDASGNLGLGVTPSAWRTDVSFKAIQMPGGTFAAYVAGGLDPTPNIAANGYVDSGGTWRYINSRAASWYIQNGGMHAWYNAPSGTAGNAISFTQAMTLEASGNLILGDTSGIGARQSVIVNGNTGIGYFRNTATSGLTTDQLQVAVGQAAGTGFFLTRMYTAATTTPTVAFSVRGDGGIYSAALTGGATTLSVDASGNIIRTPSDRNLKTNDTALPYGLAEVNKMRPIIHEWTSEANMGDGKSIGFIAQEMEEIIPEVVSGEETKSLDYPKLVAVLTAAIQELTTRLEALEAKA